MAEQLYQHTIVATGEVRDADGNLIETVHAETTETVTEDELRDLLSKVED